MRIRRTVQGVGSSRRDRVLNLILLFALFLVLPLGNASALPLSGLVAMNHALTQPLIRPVQFFQPFFAPPPRPKAKKKRYYRKRPSRRATLPKCEHPWTYSQGLRKCICVLEGYGMSGGKCMKRAEICMQNGTWSAVNNSCQCNDGFVFNNGECIDPRSVATVRELKPGSECRWPQIPNAGEGTCGCAPGYTRSDTGQCVGKDKEGSASRTEAARADGLLTTEISLLQQCLKEAGYLKGATATRMTKRAWTAYWFFKQDYKIGSTPKGVLDADAQRKLFLLCPLAARAVGIGSQTVIARARPERGPQKDLDTSSDLVTTPAPVRKVYARPEEGCLPGDLHKLITASYGKRPGLKRCQATCVAIPKGLSNREIVALEGRGVVWCRACLEVSSNLPLDDILRIERGANVQICTRPPSRLPKWERADREPRVAYTKVRELYRTLPTANDHAGSIAVVIGNKNYQGGLPANESAHNNASAIYALLSEHLGYSQERIIDLRDATLEEITLVFDGNAEAKGSLRHLLASTPQADITVYYAGHGTTSLDGSESYLLPVDAVEHREDRTSYPLSRLYENLSGLEAKSVMVLLEAAFSRDQSLFVYAPNLPDLPARALPPKPLANLTVLTAAKDDQRTMDDPAYGIGLFTRYLIEGFAGRADLNPIGNNDGTIDSIELYAYAAHMVRLSARKSYGLLQKPAISHSGNTALSVVQAPVR